ncbi:MAG: class I SAM-dependent methyltransferase [Candidatus Tectomicrobia bacterium]
MVVELHSDTQFRYSYQAHRWHPHNKIMHMVGSYKRVLDVGCASGYLAQRFKANGCSVTGIETDPEEAEKARAYCDMVLTADANTVPASAFRDGSFDVIVYADVLEHMEHPDRVLRTQQRWLSSNGYAIVSLPNIAYMAIRLQLLLGQFNYRDFGILDRTHLRFYTLATAKELLHGAQYSVEGFAPVGWPSTIMPSWLFPTVWASGFVFQALPDNHTEK